jgi:hypothetical protein
VGGIVTAVETLWSIVDDEALVDWLGELPALRADDRPHPSEYEDLETRRRS